MSSLQQLFTISIFLLIIFLVIGFFGYYSLFDDNTFFDSFYLTLVTMSSLSLEIKPDTTAQKIFVALYSIFSIGIYLIFISLLVAYAIFWHSEVIYNGY